MKGFKAYLFFGALLLIIYVVAEYNRPVPTDWTPTYRRTDKIPFGTYLLHERLGDLFGKNSIEATRLSVYDRLEEASDAREKNAAYISITDRFAPDSSDLVAIMRFVKAGNQVFLAAEYFNVTLLDTLRLEQRFESFSKKTTRSFHFTDAPFAGKNFAFRKGQLSSSFFLKKNSRLKVLGRNNLNSANFVMLRIGAGQLFLHSNPAAFSNYALVQPATRQYAAHALSYLPQNSRIIWDDYSAYGAEGERSPMRLILSNENLRWAWYIATGTLLLFVLAEVKRRQRVIPVIKPPANRSLEFVNVIGQLYYEERDHTDLAAKKVTYFGDFVRTRYELNADDPAFEKLLARKSGADADTIAAVMQEISIVKKGAQISESGLILLNKTLEKFYYEVR